MGRCRCNGTLYCLECIGTFVDKQLTVNEFALTPEKRKATNMSPHFMRARWRMKSYLYFLIVIGLIATSAFFYVQYDKEKDKSNDNSELSSVVKKVRKIYSLPASTPTLTYVDNISRLKDEPFFDEAKNGDAVLLYVEAQQAIIYRAATNRIINVGPLSFLDETQEAESTTTTTTTIPSIASVDIIAKNNDSNRTTSRLNSDYVGRVTVKQVSTESAVVSSVVVVNNAAFADLGAQIAATLKTAVGGAPAGSPASEADIVIYVKS